jgi:Uncharacterized protein conserved in bacteria (DUF2252)
MARTRAGGPVTAPARTQRSARAPAEGLPMTALDRRDPRLHSWIILMHGRNGSDPLFLQVKEAEASVLSRYCGASPVRQSGPAGNCGPAADAASQRHHPVLAADRGRARQAATRLLRPAAPRLEILLRYRRLGAARAAVVRRAVRMDAGASTRPLRRPDRYRRLPGRLRRVRLGRHQVRRRLRRPGRARPPNPRLRANHRRT